MHKTRTDKKFKTYKTAQLGWLITWLILVIVPFGIIGAIFSKSVHDFLMCTAVILLFCLIGIIIFICVRLFFRSHVRITETELIKYKRGRAIFSIKLEDITEICYDRPPLYAYFLIAIFALTDQPMLGVVSIRYKNGAAPEIVTRYGDSPIRTLTDDEKKGGMMEYCEFLTTRQVDKIAMILGKKVSQCNMRCD